MTNHPTITIAPLSIPGAMSQAAWRCIQQADALFLQTDQSPCARPVLDAGLAYRSMDDLYASAQDFDQLNIFGDLRKIHCRHKTDRQFFFFNPGSRTQKSAASSVRKIRDQNRKIRIGQIAVYLMKGRRICRCD